MSILATYHGRCSTCDEPIVPGQRIQHDELDDTWVHVDCHAMPEKAACVCASCWTVHVGECA